MRREGKGDDVERKTIATHFREKLGTRFGEILADIAHGDWVSDRRAETARRNTANRIAVGIHDGCSGAHWLAAIRFQTDPFFRNTVGNELAQRFGADEIAILADRLGDGPQDAGADWIDLVGKVLAVEAKPGFKPQTIAGGKPDPHDPFVGEKFLSESLA